MDFTIIILALTIGLTSSLHCVGMCGPIALSLGLNAENRLKFSIRNLTYQLGRVTTYTILGAFLGIIGESFSFAGLQNFLSIGIGILMIVMVMIPKFYENGATSLKPINFIMIRVKMMLGKHLIKKDSSSLYIIGILNGLLPCGAVYATLTAAVAMGSIFKSATFMFFFGLGTLPLMFATLLFGNFLSAKQRQNILKILPIITLILGVLFILRGLELNIPFISPSSEALQLNGMEDHSM
ncbi:sulfite exporter TauE/SafE family protein [Faecalibacter rhinopitheci]|uniref:Sulfite exporter TauE/SafE family protein n=1 Tax=Faecalibacter rhinopitheci TaxID=2779678 RepID=A0A8J7K420_9FLAO|nr:sulfite exporter TauE/SafE family protein [Faecalibacter rhinopitheci]MBF0597038.1 sulfite exporter TauE/SafE family protein [Faecalibacter rhinopitheci]MBQ0147699.1 sulfite exporter TauE/SafE family protein [Candidatus Onthonaster equi]